MPSFKATGMYLEDYVPGQGKLSPGRTINSADIDMFAEWCENPSLAKRFGPDGRREVSAQLIVNLADALFQRMGCVEGTGYCNLGWTWEFKRPLYEYDTMWVQASWNTTRKSRSHPGVGIVNMTLDLLNQRDEIFAVADWTCMVLSRSSPPKWLAA